jgi:hypothetical protein
MLVEPPPGAGRFRRRPTWPLLVAVALAASLAYPQWASCAPPEAPWVLDSSNWHEAEKLLPEPVVKRIRDGDYWFKVVPVDPGRFRQNYSTTFWEASAANEGKYDLDQKTCGLKDRQTGEMPKHVVGYPFPTVQEADPNAGCKIAWNFATTNWQAEGQGATFTLDGVDRHGHFRRIKAFLHALTLLSSDIPNPKNLREATISGALEPQDVEGVSTLTLRHNDWESQDSLWAYVPSSRRARRVNAATRSDPVAGLDIFADDLNCYGGKIEYYGWKLVGEGTILAPVVQPYPFPQRQIGPTRFAVDIPYLKAAYEVPGSKGAPWLIVENLVLVARPVWIVEGESHDPYYNFGKVIMYFDKEMYRIYWKLVHNRAGEYFYTAMCGYHWSKNEAGTFSAVTPSLVMGVNDKANRAGLGGRFLSQFIERNFDPAYFSLRTLTRLTD